MSVVDKKEVDNPVEVLEKCVFDIENDKWVCGKLHILDFKRANRREMGCAIGLVSLNSEDTIEYPLSEYSDFKSCEGFKVGEGECDIEKEINQDIFDEVICVARYTDEDSPLGARKAVEYLYRTIPEGFKDEKYHLGNMEGMVGEVVNYNDSVIGAKIGKKGINAAKKWFNDALNLARSEQTL